MLRFSLVPSLQSPTSAVLDSSTKRETLIDMEARAGLDIRFAYGNATTDVCAYATAGVHPNATHIIGSNAGTACPGFEPTVAVDDYITHLQNLEPPPPNHRD